ncbi:galactose mutarotase [Clostridium sp. SHJSY1]|uniref:aldose epimerase family protein n=1 Tax=Clostridium sp. SHJSY1 TaxID=2942483 RepID=UPI0028755060|nr:aldose epimerase family protein [Clostridium sp. SHJSY1]MDS0525148.1 galactose mutarotase [Clostridium sp. SHJSY1]
MTIKREFFGKTPEGENVDIFTLTNKEMTVKISNFGGVVISIIAPDRNGQLDDIVLGYDNLEGYLKNEPYLGSIVGRHANRIEGAEFELNGEIYKLNKNEGQNNHHGGVKGFNKVLWGADIVSKEGEECLELSYLSKDGEEGFPGNLKVKVIYKLTKENALEIHYFAETDKDTVVNLTSHSYFNLSGHTSGNIFNHKIMINGDKFTVVNENGVPTGEIRSVENTPLNLREEKFIKEGLFSDYEQIKFGKGYDHNWVLNVSGKEPEKAAEIYDETSGRAVSIYTTKPGIQLYTGNYLDEHDNCKENANYNEYAALALETQYFPNSLKHKNFPSPILKVGEKYNHITIYKFFTK